MKIMKKASNIEANEAIVLEPVPDAAAELVPVAELAGVEATPCPYQNAIDLITAAIESLASIAKGDELAKDSIANLGVVLMDLKGGCQ